MQSSKPVTGPSHYAPVGTVHTWTDGVSYVKTTDGWEPRNDGAKAPITQAKSKPRGDTNTLNTDLTKLSSNPRQRVEIENQIRGVDQIMQAMGVKFDQKPTIIATRNEVGESDTKKGVIAIAPNGNVMKQLVAGLAASIDSRLSGGGDSQIKHVAMATKSLAPSVHEAYHHILTTVNAHRPKESPVLTPEKCFESALNVALGEAGKVLQEKNLIKPHLFEEFNFHSDMKLDSVTKKNLLSSVLVVVRHSHESVSKSIDLEGLEKYLKETPILKSHLLFERLEEALTKALTSDGNLETGALHSAALEAEVLETADHELLEALQAAANQAAPEAPFEVIWSGLHRFALTPKDFGIFNGSLFDVATGDQIISFDSLTLAAIAVIYQSRMGITPEEPKEAEAVEPVEAAIAEPEAPKASPMEALLLALTQAVESKANGDLHVHIHST